MKQTLLLSLFAAALCVRVHAIAPPDARNTLHIIPIWNAMGVSETSEATIRTESRLAKSMHHFNAPMSNQ